MARAIVAPHSAGCLGPLRAAASAAGRLARCAGHQRSSTGGGSQEEGPLQQATGAGGLAGDTPSEAAAAAGRPADDFDQFAAVGSFSFPGTAASGIPVAPPLSAGESPDPFDSFAAIASSQQAGPSTTTAEVAAAAVDSDLDLDFFGQLPPSNNAGQTSQGTHSAAVMSVEDLLGFSPAPTPNWPNTAADDGTSDGGAGGVVSAGVEGGSYTEFQPSYHTPYQAQAFEEANDGDGWPAMDAAAVSVGPLEAVDLGSVDTNDWGGFIEPTPGGPASSAPLTTAALPPLPGTLTESKNDVDDDADWDGFVEAPTAGVGGQIPAITDPVEGERMALSEAMPQPGVATTQGLELDGGGGKNEWGGLVEPAPEGPALLAPLTTAALPPMPGTLTERGHDVDDDADWDGFVEAPTADVGGQIAATTGPVEGQRVALPEAMPQPGFANTQGLELDEGGGGANDDDDVWGTFEWTPPDNGSSGGGSKPLEGGTGNDTEVAFTKATSTPLHLLNNSAGGGSDDELGEVDGSNVILAAPAHERPSPQVPVAGDVGPITADLALPAEDALLSRNSSEDGSKSESFGGPPGVPVMTEPDNDRSLPVLVPDTVEDEFGDDFWKPLAAARLTQQQAIGGPATPSGEAAANPEGDSKGFDDEDEWGAFTAPSAAGSVMEAVAEVATNDSDIDQWGDFAGPAAAVDATTTISQGPSPPTYSQPMGSQLENGKFGEALPVLEAVFALDMQDISISRQAAADSQSANLTAGALPHEGLDFKEDKGNFLKAKVMAPLPAADPAASVKAGSVIDDDEWGTFATSFSTLGTTVPQAPGLREDEWGSFAG
eukprot:SM000004S15119  [mRNA]  locus=s4:1339936:1342567:- [translate_table: standard]